MTRARKVPDGLPYRVYERKGVFVYSIGYMMPGGKWAFRHKCPVTDTVQIVKLRSLAVMESLKIGADYAEAPTNGFGRLIDDWFEWQKALPPNIKGKRSASTIKENLSESKNLRKAFGHLSVEDMTPSMAYDYLEACLTAKDPKGNPRPRPIKGNKEIALARAILQYGVRKNKITVNPFNEIEKNEKTDTERRLVTPEELALAVEMGRKIGGPQHIVALALQTAYLCVRRSVEVRALTRDAVTDAGILWKDGKSKTKPSILIAWTPELRATIDEALTVKRNKGVGTMYLFGSLRGTKYTKGGWKASLDDLMHPCAVEALTRKQAFKRFSLQNCRPMAVTDKLEHGDTDTATATGHTSDAMIKKHYDLRTVRRATGARIRG